MNSEVTSNQPLSELTYGGKAVGITFNPSNDNLVDRIKAKYAEIIDICNDQRNKEVSPETKRILSIAITEAQTAQMWAVKGVTFKY